jgi:hypothetical protein
VKRGKAILAYLSDLLISDSARITCFLLGIRLNRSTQWRKRGSAAGAASYRKILGIGPL